MVIGLFDYQDKIKEFEVGSLEGISKIDMVVLSGDEVMTVHYKNGSKAVFDSSTNRTTDYTDMSYVLYDSRKDSNTLFNPAWVHRTSSYN